MKIAVICAFPAGLNAGMLSVDLALTHTLSKISINIEVTRFCAESELIIPFKNNFIYYCHLENKSQLEKFDRIIYWGDFLHWIGYGMQDYLIRQSRRNDNLTNEQIIDNWFELFLLEYSPKLQKKSIIFGTTIYGLNASQISNPRYFKALKNLYTNARLVQMRDIFSANFVSQISPSQSATFGCDCALLVDSTELVLEKITEKSGYIAYSFERSNGSLALIAWTRQIAQLCNKKIYYLPWLDNSGYAGLQTKLDIIKGADYIITDIYHLSVSALREGIPTLCVGRGTLDIQNSLSEKKKEIFFGQAFAYQNYIYFENLLDAMKSNYETMQLANKCVNILQDNNSNAIIFNSLKEQASLASKRLTKAILD